MLFSGDGSGPTWALKRAFAQCLLVLLLFGVSLAGEAEPVKCDPKTGVWDFGEEWVADTCVSKFMTDDAIVHYQNNLVSCDRNSHTVVLRSPFGDDEMTPESFISYAQGVTATGGRPYKIFRNREGTHFLLVHPDYTGTIDEKDMTAYAGGVVYTDVFSRGLVLPTAPICNNPQPCNSCPCPKGPIGSTVDLISGGLSHDQELFSVKGGQSPLAGSLYYRSDPFAPSSIGKGWSHSWEVTLQAGGDGVTIWDHGDVRDYRLTDSGYRASSGDYSVLAKNGDGSYTLTEKNGTVRSFDTSGRIVSEIDTDGNTTSYTYTDGRLTRVVDPGGRSATFSYDASGKLATVQDPGSHSYGFSYTDGFLTRITAPDQGTWDYTYTGSGMLETKTDPLGNTTTYSYDADNRATAGTDPQGATRSFDFANRPAGKPGKIPDPYPRCKQSVAATTDNHLQITSAGFCDEVAVPALEKNGSRWNYSYEYTSGTLRSKTDPYGNTTSYTRDGYGNVLTKTEPGVGTTWYTYDAAGNTTSIKDPLGNTTTYTYNSLGQVLTSTGPRGNTSNEYDAKGNLTSSTDAAGARTAYEYDQAGNVTRITNAKNQAIVITYTAAGQLETVTDPAGIVTAYTYDPSGNMLTSTDPGGTNSYSYDGMNRLKTITDPLGNVTSYGYDTQGNRTSQTDANGNTTNYKYSYQGQVTEVEDAVKAKTGFAYGTSSCSSCNSGVDKLTALTDAKQQTTRYDYDLASRLIKETDPLNNTISYTYDSAGNIATRTDANASITSYTYDALRRLTGKSYPDGSGESYSYDGAGRMLTAANKDLSYSFAYDSGGRLQRVSDSRGFVLEYESDIIANRTKTTLQPGAADQHVTSYGYDTANRPNTVTSSSGTFTYSYNAQGRRSSIAYPNGITAGYRYDSLGRLTGVTHAAGSTTIAFANYSGFDKTGNRKGRVTGRGPESYDYDLVYRLTRTTTAAGAENYGYDSVGNRLSGPGPKDTKYSYNAGNQMITGRILNYLYDGNGNQASRARGSSGGKSWSETWDYENRLVKMEQTKGAERRTVTFKYDPLGRRIEKNLTTVVNGAAKTASWKYVYDGDDIALEVYNDPAQVTTRTYYTHGAGVDEHLALERGGSSYYYHADGLGSVVAITDAYRNVVQGYEYDSFGVMRPSAAFANAYTYTGREWDKETGLYYYRARYYDPMEGRFISKDPIGFKGGDVNEYGYTKNNPTNYTDPTGLQVYICSRPTHFNVLGADVSVGYHFWIKTGTAEAGMGAKPGDIPGQHNSDFPGVPVQVISHPGESTTAGANCVPLEDVDEACVNNLLKEGRPLGRWWPTNQCQSFSVDVLSQCSTAAHIPDKPTFKNYH